MEEPEDVQKNGTSEPTNDASTEPETASSNKEQEHFCCSFCQDRFLAIEELLSHIRIHTGGVDSEEDQDEPQVPQKLKRLSVRLPLLKTGKMPSLDSTEGRDKDGEGETSHNIPSTSKEDEKCGSEFKGTHSASGYQCPTCNRRFSRIIHQLNHKCEPTSTENRLDAINSGLKLYKCITCMQEFGTRQEKQDHQCLTSETQDQEEYESQNSPDPADQEVSDHQEESDIEKEEEDDFEAAPTIARPKLVIKFQTKKGFGKSRRRKAKGTHRCDVCHKSFTRGWNLKVHAQKAHPPGGTVQSKNLPAKSSPRASPRPAKRTQEPAALLSDSVASNSDGICDFDFRPSYSEKNMVLRRVQSSNAYECPLCGKTMERREATLSHIRDHRGENPYHCSHCDFKCAHSAKIIKHLSQTHKIHRPNNPPEFEASKGISQDSDWQPRKEPYRNFYKIVRSEKERMYKPVKDPDTGYFACPICHKTFARFGVAQVHIRIHTGEAPFRCLLCEYQGKQQSLVLAHLEHNHKDIISNRRRDEEVDAELAMEDGDDDVDEEEWEKSIDYEEGIVNDKAEDSEEESQGHESESFETPEDQEPTLEEPPVENKYDFKFRPTQHELDRVLFRSSLTKMYLCHLCTKEIKEKEIMLAHIRTHTGDKAYYCYHCDFGSAHDAAMRKHLLNVHGIKHAKRPENNVQTHIRLISKRPPSKPVMVTSTKASESPKTSTKTNSKKPVKVKIKLDPAEPKQKTPNETAQHKVVVKKQPKKESLSTPALKQSQGPSYADFYTVNKSEKEEECKPQRNVATGLYKCHFCKLESYSYKTVVIHTRSHTGEKPYKCRLCTFSAGQSSHVIRHLKNTHRVSLDGADESDDADEEPPELRAEETEEPAEGEGNDQDEGNSEPQDDVDDNTDLDPVDYFAPSVPEEPIDPLPLPPKLVYKDDDSIDETVEEGSQEGGDNDPDWETWMDRKTLTTEVRSAYKGKGKGKITSPRNAQVNYIFAPSDAEKQLGLKKGADKQFECPTCGKKMRELEIILAHIRTHSGDKPYMCCHCDFVSAHIASIRKHVVRVHNVKRPVAGSDHQTPLAPAVPKVQVTPKPKEPKKVTVSSPETKESVDRDFEQAEGDVDLEERPYSEGTNEGYINNFFKVMRRVKSKEKKYIPTRDSLSGRAQCRICKGTFSSYGKAVVHIRSHTGEKPYECVLCDYKSSQNPNMKRHIRNQHKDRLYGGLDGAKQPADPSDPDAAVDESFQELPDMDDDDDDHDLSGPSMVQRSDFLSQAAVAEQGASQPGRPDYLYEPTERMKNFEPKRCATTGMFECTFCSSQFYGLKKIETHVLKHTGEKPYLCMHCDFKSAYSFVMYRHLLKRHNIQTPKHPGGTEDQLDDIKASEVDGDMSGLSEAQESDSAYYTTSKPQTQEQLPSAVPAAAAAQSYPEGDFDFVFRPSDFEMNQVIESIGGGRLKCPHCKKVMSNRKKMITHIRTHTGSKPFLCCHCDFKTAYKFVIQTHMKGIHKILEPKGDDELMEVQRLQESLASSAATVGAEQPAGGVESIDKVVIKQEPPDDTDANVSGPGGSGFAKMVASMSVEAAGSEAKGGTPDDESIGDDDDNLSDFSIQKDGQQPDCVFRPTDTEKNRKLYRPNPSGPSQCPFCSRWLQGLENMRAHIRGHTGEKPYLCCHCDQKSAHFAAIKRHLIKVHKLKRPVMPGDVGLHPKSKQQNSTPKLMVKFKNVSYPSSPLKPTQTKFKPMKPQSSSSSSKKSMEPFTGRDRSLTQFYRNFYTVNKSEDLKKFTPKKDPVTKQFHCNFCGKQFNYHTEAQVHTRTHTGEKPYACLICEYKGSQWTNIVRHITCVHKRILEDKQREEGIGNPPPAKSDDLKPNTSSFSPESSRNYASPLNLATNSKSSSEYESLQGPDMTSSKQDADYMFNPSEEEKKRVILPSPRTGLYSCLHCKKKVPNLGKIVTHLRTHSGDKPYICLHCNFKSAYKFVMKQHLSGRHSIKNPKQLSTGDDGEGNAEGSPEGMTANVPLAAPVTAPGHPTNIKTDFRFQPSERETTMDLKRQETTGCFECPFCGRQFSSSETIKAHIRGHTGDKAYYCNHCTFASAHIKSIRNHIQKVHMITHPRRSDDHAPPTILAIPQLQLQQQQQPRQHPQQRQQKVVSATQIPKEIYLKYVGVRKTGPKKFPPKRNPRTGRFKCHFCTMESKQLYTVEIHTMRHTGEKPYECKLCEYKATRQWLVTQHLQTNHKHILAANEGLTLIPKETMKPPAPTAVKLPLSETPSDGIVVCRSAKTGLYYCSECRKEFMNASQCREHISTHSGDKQYQCPFCNHRSAHGGAMRNHMKIQHGNDAEELKKWYTYTMGKIALRHTFQRDQDGMYMCNYCNKKSSSLNSARKHLCVHTGEKPYSCKLCSFKAIHNISIRLHVTGHHKQITSAFSQSGTPSTTTQPGPYNSAGDVGSEGRLGEEEDEDDWEEEQALEDQMASKEQPKLKLMEGLEGYTATTSATAIPPVGQVSVKDADFLYVPSDVDKELILQRSLDSQMYECPICNKQMTNTRTMRAHIRLHKGEKAYHCCHCDYKSAHYSVLRKHVVQVHKIQRPRMAQDAEEQEGPWTQKMQDGVVKDVPPLDEEMANIDDLQLENPSKIPTNMNPDTDSGFLFDANEDEKLSWQELQSSGSCQCPQCGKHCSSPIRTLQHMRTHSGAKPYHCRYCSFRSAYDTSMRNHVRTLHETGGAWASAQKVNGSELAERDEESEANATTSEIAALERLASAPTQVKIKKEKQDNGYDNKSSGMDGETPEMAWTFNEEDQSATLVPQYMAPPIIEEEDGPPSLQPESSPGGEGRAVLEPSVVSRLSQAEIKGKTPSMMKKFNMIQKPPIMQGTVTGDFTYTPTQQEKDRVVDRSSTSGQYKCPFCPQELTSVDKIKAHIRKHTGDRPYQCLHCKFNSAYRFVIRTHIKNLHKVPEPKQYKGEVLGENNFPPILESCVDNIKSKSAANLGGLADVYRPILVDEKRSSPKRFLAAGKVSWDGHFKYIQSETEKRLVLNRCSSTGKYQCPDCNKVLGNIDVMRAHVRTHTGEKPYYCCHCDFQSAHYDSIRKHLIVIHKLKHEDDGKSSPNVDTEWLEPYLKPKPLEPHSVAPKSLPKPQLVKKSPQSGEERYEVDRYRHLFDVVKEASSKKDRKGQTFKRNPITRAYKCNYCPKESKHHYVIQIHERLHTGEKPYRCRLCDYKGAQQSRIVFHLKTKHDDYLQAQGLQQEETAPDPLETMEEAAIDDAIEPEHSEASNQEHYVPKLGVDFICERIESEEVLLEKIQQSRDYKCLTCGKRCANAVRTIEHMRQHTGAKPYACMRCSTRSAYDRAIRNHVLLQHGRNAKEKDKLYTFHPGKLERKMELHRHPATDRFMCPFCGKTFRDVNLAKSHVRMHTGETPYRCKLCKFKGANTRAILVHIERVHGNRSSEASGILPSTNVPAESEILRKRLKLDDDLLNSEVSSNNSVAQSDDDDASLKLEEQAVGISKMYEGPKIGVDFTCDKIQSENMYCIDPETGGYKCLYCDKVMKSHVSKIKNHLLLHTGAKPFKCVHCEFRSAHDGSMRTHVLSQHRKISRAHEKLYKFKVGKIERSLRLDQEPTGAYVCPYCPKRCRDLNLAKKHIRSHTGEKPFHCRKCSYMATMKWSVILHAQRQHNVKKTGSKSKSGSKVAAEVKDGQKLSAVEEEGKEEGMKKNNDKLADGDENVAASAVEKPENMEATDTKKGDKTNNEELKKDSGVADELLNNNEIPSNTPACSEGDNNNESHMSVDESEVKDKTRAGAEVNEQQDGDGKVTGRLEIDGAPALEAGTPGNEQKAEAEIAESSIPLEMEHSDVDGKLEIDDVNVENVKDAEEQVTAGDLKDNSENKEAEAAGGNDQEKVEGNTDIGVDEKSVATDNEKGNDEMDQDGQEKTDVNEGGKESNHLQETGKVELEDEATTRPPQQRSNSPDYIFKQSKEEKNFFKSNASGSFDCPHCTKQFKDIVVMQTHWRNHTGEMPYHCLHCSFKSARFPNIRQHLLLTHKIHRPKSGPKRCKEEVPMPDLKKTKPLSNEVMVDKYRSLFSFVPSKTSNFKPIRNSVTGLFECPLCGSTSKRSNGARVHYRTHTGEKPYHCLLCPYKGAQQSRVVTHIKYNHQDDIVANLKSLPVLDQISEQVPEKVEEKEEFEDQDEMMEEDDDDEDGGLVIDEEKGAKRKMLDDSGLASGVVRSAHEPMWKKGYEYRPSKAESELVLEQDSNGVFMCPTCPHKHKLKNVVRNHVRKHTGEKPYFCFHCDFTTANFSSIRTHLIQAHKSMPHKRDESPGQDQEAKKVRLHMEEEELPRGEETATEGYTFTRSLLEKSLRLQRTVRGKYQCPYCVYEYVALAIVMAHVRTHTGDKPFQCNYCPYSAADYSAMRKHLIKKHDKWQPKAKTSGGAVVNQADSETPPELSREPQFDDGRHDGGHAFQDQSKHSEGLHYTFTWGEAEKGLSFHKSEAGLYQCPYCPHQHKKKSVVRAHVRKHTGETPYQCKHCTFKCANFSWMREHLIKRHDLKAEQLSNKSKVKESSSSMSHVQDVSLVVQSNVNPAAERSVSPAAETNISSDAQSSAIPQQKSPKFDFLFAPSDTEKHVELSRTSTGSYKCVFCQKELRIINNMRAHIRGHIGDKPYYCTRCQFKSAHISALRRHLFSQHRIRNAKGQKSTKQVALAMTNPPRLPSRPQPEAIPVIQPLKSSVDPASSPIIHNILTAHPPATETRPPAHRGYPQPQLQSPPPRTNTYQTKGPKYVYEETPSEIALLKNLQASNTLQCPHCAHKFSSISRTMEHVRKHTGAKPYRCIVCNFKSAYEGCISRHVSLKHELSAQQLAQFFTFKIGEIEKSTDLQKNPETGHYHCPFCEKSWPESAKVKRHMCIHTGEKPYRCNLCGFGAVDKSSMVHHLEMSHKKQITELKDTIADQEQSSLMPHFPPMQISPQQQRTNFMVESKESTKLVLRRVPETQHELARKLPSPQQLRHDRRQPSTSSVLKVPNLSNSVSNDTDGYDYKPSPSEQELLHKLNTEGKVRCHYCGKICHSAARTLEHVRMHSGEKPYCCRNCKFASAYEGVMKKHVMVRHGKGTDLSVLYSFKAGKILKSIEFQREENTGRYKCPFCRRTTTSLTGAKRHVCTHTGEKPYKCNLCSYCANERSTILWHIDRQHKNAGEHVPDAAQQQRHQQKQQHQERQHQHKVDQRKAAVTQALGLAPIATPSPPTNRSVVSINRRGHIDFNPTPQFRKVRVKPGDTEGITKLFTFEPGKIERSLNLQRDPDNGRYLCPFCEQTSRDLTNAKNHVRVHIGEKPFKCKLCDYGSVQRSLVIAHIEKHHVVYPSTNEYFPQEPSARRHASSSPRQHLQMPSSGFANSHRHSPVSQFNAPPAPVNDMPLDLSKPLDLSSSSKPRQREPEHTHAKPIGSFAMPNDNVAMDLSAGSHGVQEESQESSMDDDEEAALLEAEMLAEEEEEMMAGDDGTEEDEEMMGEDEEDRLLAEEMLADEASEHEPELVQSHHDEALSTIPNMMHKPVSLVKPLNPNEANENEDSVGLDGKSGANVTIGLAVTDANSVNPAVMSRSKKSERNIWDMAFNWSSGKKEQEGQGEKPSTARSLRYADAGQEADDHMLEMSDDNEDVLEEDADDVVVAARGEDSDEAGVLQRLLQKGRTQRHDGDDLVANDVNEHGEAITDDITASEDPTTSMEADVHLPSVITDGDRTSTVVSSPHSSPLHDTSVSQETPSSSPWQRIQELTPTKPQSSASSALTPEGDTSDGQDELGSPSSGGLPIITNVMSLNPSLWKSP